MAVRFYEYSFCSFYATHGVVKRKRSVCIGMIKRERSVCVGTTKRIGNVACDVSATHTLRVLFYDRYCMCALLYRHFLALTSAHIRQQCCHFPFQSIHSTIVLAQAFAYPAAFSTSIGISTQEAEYLQWMQSQWSNVVWKIFT